MKTIEERQWEALEIINDLLQACSYADKMNNVMFKIPLELAIKAENFLSKEHYYEKKYKLSASSDDSSPIQADSSC